MASTMGVDSSFLSTLWGLPPHNFFRPLSCSRYRPGLPAWDTVHALRREGAGLHGMLHGTLVFRSYDTLPSTSGLTQVHVGIASSRIQACLSAQQVYTASHENTVTIAISTLIIRLISYPALPHCCTIVMSPSMLHYGVLASLALFPALVVTQSGDLNSLSLVLSRFEDLSTLAELITVILRALYPLSFFPFFFFFKKVQLFKMRKCT